MLPSSTPPPHRNVRYEFNATDMEVSVETLRMFLDEQPHIPWEALSYVTGQIHYGGRVTDDWDRRCLMCILDKYYRPDILEDGYLFDESGSYYAPDLSHMEGGLASVREYVEGLPLEDGVGLFGLHQNARITFETQETYKFLDTVVSLQPRTGGGATGESAEEMISSLCARLADDLPPALTREEAGATTFAVNEKGSLDSLQTVLLHEMSRFNKLIATVAATLADLRKVRRVAWELQPRAPVSERAQRLRAGDSRARRHERGPGRHVWRHAHQQGARPLGEGATIRARRPRRRWGRAHGRCVRRCPSSPSSLWAPG